MFGLCQVLCVILFFICFGISNIVPLFKATILRGSSLISRSFLLVVINDDDDKEG